jgi:aspartate-semialdehyde dehydrogenase
MSHRLMRLTPRAVDGAQQAFAAWSGLLPQERSVLLRRWFELLTHKETSADYGAGQTPVPSLVVRLAMPPRLSNSAQKRQTPEHRRRYQPSARAEVEVWLEPVGVAAPDHAGTSPVPCSPVKAAAAMAVGCTVVAHPSGETPFSALG